MADETSIETPSTDGVTSTQPNVTVVLQQPSAPPVVTATPDMDVTIEGGAYRTQAGNWVNAEGQPIDAPKGKGKVK